MGFYHTGSNRCNAHHRRDGNKKHDQRGICDSGSRTPDAFAGQQKERWVIFPHFQYVGLRSVKMTGIFCPFTSSQFGKEMESLLSNIILEVHNPVHPARGYFINIVAVFDAIFLVLCHTGLSYFWLLYFSVFRIMAFCGHHTVLIFL